MIASHRLWAPSAPFGFIQYSLMSLSSLSLERQSLVLMLSDQNGSRSVWFISVDDRLNWSVV